KNIGSGNYAAKFADLAKINGFKSYWVPAGEMINNVSVGAIKSMVDAGLSGVFIQEQRKIESACPADRAIDINQMIDKFATNGQVEVGIQLMTERCKTADAFAKTNCSGVSDEP
ncbi:MAG: hypothetical protein U0946_06140, partial [Patescibacteria group bacterium]|nr:hypothetical protein [Patescibacteria group bacterium]